MTKSTRKFSKLILGATIQAVAILLVLVGFGASATFAQTQAYVIHGNDQTVSVIEVATNTVVATVPVPASWGSSQDKKPESRATSAKAASVATATDTQTSHQAQAMKGLRNRLLTSSPEEVGLSGADAKAKVWGVLMEVAFPTAAVTLVSVRDGTASIYTNTGGGILGGYSAQKEAKRFVLEAEKHLASMKPTKSFPYPEVRRIKFYVLTRDGVYTAEVDEEEVQRAGHALFELFLAGNEVLTALRTANERSNPDR